MSHLDQPGCLILCRASFRAGRSLPPFTLGKKPPKITMRSECVRLSSPLAEPALRPGQSDAQRAARGRVPRSRASSKLLTSHSAHFVLVLRTLRHSDRFYQCSRLVDPCAENFAPFRRLTDCGNKMKQIFDVLATFLRFFSRVVRRMRRGPREVDAERPPDLPHEALEAREVRCPPDPPPLPRAALVKQLPQRQCP